MAGAPSLLESPAEGALGSPFLVGLQRLGVSPTSFTGFALLTEVDPPNTDFPRLFSPGICRSASLVFLLIVHFYFSLSIGCAQDRTDGAEYL